jgi:hypothetical protein
MQTPIMRALFMADKSEGVSPWALTGSKGNEQKELTAAQQEVLDPKLWSQTLKEKTDKLAPNAGDPNSGANPIADMQKAVNHFVANKNRWTPEIVDEFVNSVAEADHIDQAKLQSVLTPLKERALPTLLIAENKNADLVAEMTKEQNAVQLGLSTTDLKMLAQGVQTFSTLDEDKDGLTDKQKASVRESKAKIITAIQAMSQPVGDKLKELSDYQAAKTNADKNNPNETNAEVVKSYGQLSQLERASLSTRMTFVNAILTDVNPKGLTEQEQGLVQTLEQESVDKAPDEIKSTVQQQIGQMNQQYVAAFQQANAPKSSPEAAAEGESDTQQ